MCSCLHLSEDPSWQFFFLLRCAVRMPNCNIIFNLHMDSRKGWLSNTPDVWWTMRQDSRTLTKLLAVKGHRKEISYHHFWVDIFDVVDECVKFAAMSRMSLVKSEPRSMCTNHTHKRLSLTNLKSQKHITINVKTSHKQIQSLTTPSNHSFQEEIYRNDFGDITHKRLRVQQHFQILDCVNLCLEIKISVWGSLA